MASRLRDNGISILFFVLFLAALSGQAIAGYLENNEARGDHGLQPESAWAFLASSQFLVDVTENWQSEFLQFFVFIAATIWLVQRGSPETKKPGEEGIPGDKAEKVGPYAAPESPDGAKRHGLARTIYENSLLLVMGAAFVLSWLAQSVAGRVAFNAEQAEHAHPAITWLEYLTTPDFWNRSLQNWQSEFLAVGAMIVFSIFLRQRGSSESKPVGEAHDAQ